MKGQSGVLRRGQRWELVPVLSLTLGFLLGTLYLASLTAPVSQECGRDLDVNVTRQAPEGLGSYMVSALVFM